MTAIWTPSKELSTPKHPAFRRRVSEWCRMAAGAVSTCGGKVNTANGKVSTNANQTGGCGCSSAPQVCVQSFLFSGIGAACSKGYYVSSNMNLSYPIFAQMSTAQLPNNFPLQGIALPCSGTATATPIAASSSNTSPSLGVYYVGSGPGSLFPTTVDANNGFTPGTFNSSYGPAATLTVEYPSSSPFPQTIPSAVTVGGGPITSVRSPSTGLAVAVSSSSYAAWDETVPLSLGVPCSGLYYGFTGSVSDVSKHRPITAYGNLGTS